MNFSVAKAARRCPHAAALVTNGVHWTYAQLAARVRREAAGLSSLVAGGWARLTATATAEFVVRLAALWQLNVTPVLLHPRWREAEQRRARTAVPQAVDLDEVAFARAGDRVETPVPIPGPRPMAVLFSSGSSGAPKGVALSKQAFRAAATASAARLGWRQDDRWLLALPPAHVGGLSVLTRCLAARRPVVLAASQEPAAMLEVVARHRVTLTSLVPAQLARLLAASAAPPPSLRAVLVGGGPCPPALLTEGRRLGWPLLPTYGLTEACSQVATVAPGEEPVGCGRPLGGVEVQVREREIHLRGATLFDGYLENGQVVPALDEEGWFATGDLGELDVKGNLHVFGRKDDVIVTGGENVAPAEVEAVLRGCPGVTQALVVGVPHPVWGAVVGALLVAGSAEPPPDEVVHGHLAESLAAFKRPRLLRWVKELPLAPSGKPDRAAARALLSDPTPNRSGGQAAD